MKSMILTLATTLTISTMTAVGAFAAYCPPAYYGW